MPLPAIAAVRTTLLTTLLTAVLAVAIGLIGFAAEPALSRDKPVAAAITFTDDDIKRIVAIGVWPPPEISRRDPTNRVSGNPLAIRFGRQLFESPQLSINQTISCQSCHRPELGFSDGRDRAQGLARGDRNTQSLWNMSMQRWYGWDGGADSLWAASIRPMLNPLEMGATPEHIHRQIQLNAAWLRQYQQLFGEPRNADMVLANVGKSVAAYLETLVSPSTEFDRFRLALALNNSEAIAAYPAAAKRGLQLFLGKGNCTVCHTGANFSNGEFHDVAIPFLVAPGRVDPGRHSGIRRTKSDRFNLLGRFNDEVGTTSKKPAEQPNIAPLPAAIKTQTVQLAHRNWGEWRTPSLRNLRHTAPYMHNGSLASLRDVVRHYSTINQERLHSDGEQLLKPLQLTDAEIDDLVAFLLSLSD